MRESGLRYGMDGYPYVVGLGAGAVVLGATAAALSRSRGALRGLGWVLWATAAACAVPSALGVDYVLRGKLRLRDVLLDQVDWRGDEVVADFGCGRGLLAIGAAQRTNGDVYGLDLFVAKDLWGNTPEHLQRNARSAGVEDRVHLRIDDVRAVSLPDASVDVVVSSLCVHNIESEAGRDTALGEMVRVLRAGGTLVISDLAHVDRYAATLRRAGLIVTEHGLVSGIFPLQRLLTARHPDPGPEEV